MQTKKDEDLQMLEDFLSSPTQRVAMLVCLTGVFIYIFAPNRLSSVFDFQLIYGYSKGIRKAEIYDSIWQILIQVIIWGSAFIALLWPKLRAVLKWAVQKNDAELTRIQEEVRTEMARFERVAKDLDSGDIGQGEYDYKKAVFDMRMEELSLKLKRF